MTNLLRSDGAQDYQLGSIKPIELVTLNGFIVEASERFSVHDDEANQRFIYDLTDFAGDFQVRKAIFDVLCVYLRTKSLIYSNRSLSFVKEFCMSAPGSGEIGVTNVNAFLHARQTRGTKPRQAMAFVIPFLRTWQSLGFAGLRNDLRLYLGDDDGKIEGVNYEGLRTNDPERGALTRKEMWDISAAVNQAYAKGGLDTRQFAIMWVFIGTGVRPIQVSRMRMRDVVLKGEDVYLNIPWAKGEGAYEGQRTQLRAPTVLAEVLRHYLSVLGEDIDPDAPLFPSTMDPALPASPPELSTLVRSVGHLLAIRSARLDDVMPLFPYRFRYTVGTRAVELGASDHQVARLLTHRTIVAAKAYRAATAEGQSRIADELGPTMGTIAGMFTGRIIPSLDYATRAGEVDALIRDYERLSGRKVGACGTRAECVQLAPIACLTCSQFEPFADAPFEDLKVALVYEQEEEADPRIKEIYDPPLAALDELIGQQQRGWPAFEVDADDEMQEEFA